MPGERTTMRQVRSTSLRQTGDRLFVLVALFCPRTCRSTPRRPRGLARRKSLEGLPDVGLDREGDFVQHVGGLMNPTPLVPGARKDFLDRLPEAERAVGDLERGRGLPVISNFSTGQPCVSA